jgi:hypothetical protein
MAQVVIGMLMEGNQILNRLRKRGCLFGALVLFSFVGQNTDFIMA